MSEAISDATKTHFSEIVFTHAGILIETEEGLQVLEASPEGGVRYATLDDFLARSKFFNGRPLAAVMRLRDTTGLAASLERARQHLGEAYDFSYRPNNGKSYCSELIYENYLDSCGRPLFTASPMNFRAADGTMPAFWTELFARLGEPVPEGVMGTNPNDMARETCIVTVQRFYFPEREASAPLRNETKSKSSR